MAEPEEAVTTAEREPVRNVKLGCICLNQGRPDANGVRCIDPCCRVHYAERNLFVHMLEPETEITEAEIRAWKRREKKRVSYPKMTVARP